MVDKKVTPRRRSRRLHRRRARAREDDPHDQTVQRQGFGEDEDEQDPGEQLGLLRVRAHARVACDADGHPSREAGKTARQAGGEVRVPLEQGVPLGVNFWGGGWEGKRGLGDGTTFIFLGFPPQKV